MNLVYSVLIAFAAIQGQVQTASTAAGSANLNAFLVNVNQSIQSLEPVVSSLLNIDSDALADQFKAISYLIKSIPVTVQNISATAAAQQNPSLDAFLKITSLVLRTTESYIEDISDIATNITSILNSGFDTTVKKAVNEIDSRLSNAANASLSRVLNGALVDCVDPMSDMFTTFCLGLSSGFQDCVNAELDTLNGFLVQINGIIKSLDNIVVAANTTLNSCRSRNLFCLQPLIASISTDGAAIPIAATTLVADITEFYTNIQTRFTTCLTTMSAAVVYETALLSPNLFKCVFF